MAPIGLVVAYCQALLAERLGEFRKDSERGEIVQTVVIISAFVAAAIVITAILVAKATSKANSVTTQ